MNIDEYFATLVYQVEIAKSLGRTRRSRRRNRRLIRSIFAGGWERVAITLSGVIADNKVSKNAD